MPINLRVTALAFGGPALGRSAGRVVFVPFAAPGDLVRVRVCESRARWARAELLELLEPGAARRVPPCPLAGRCGGCPWQHVDYAAQWAAKQEIVAHALRPLAPPPIEFVAAPAELHYRRRVRLRWQRGPGGLRLGFHGWRRREIVDLAACPLLVPALDRGLKRLRTCLSSGPPARGTLALLAGLEQEVHFSLRVEQGAVPVADAWLGDGVVGGVVGGEDRPPCGYGQPDVVIDRRGLRASAACFAQANAAQDEALRARLQALSAVAAGRAVLELYAGCGNLTAALDRRVASVLAVESDREAAALLLRNRALVRPPLELRSDTAAAAVAALAREGSSFPLIVLDPPREGAREIMAALAPLASERIVYVSCDPPTLVRDLSVLLAQGFRLTSVFALDTMPQTHHLELVVAMDRGA